MMSKPILILLLDLLDHLQLSSATNFKLKMSKYYVSPVRECVRTFTLSSDTRLK